MNPKKITIKKSSPQKKEGGKSSSHYHGPKGQLAVDVYQTSDEFVVKSPIGESVATAFKTRRITLPLLVLGS